MENHQLQGVGAHQGTTCRYLEGIDRELLSCSSLGVNSYRPAKCLTTVALKPQLLPPWSTQFQLLFRSCGAGGAKRGILSIKENGNTLALVNIVYRTFFRDSGGCFLVHTLLLTSASSYQIHSIFISELSENILPEKKSWIILMFILVHGLSPSKNNNYSSWGFFRTLAVTNHETPWAPDCEKNMSAATSAGKGSDVCQWLTPVLLCGMPHITGTNWVMTWL